MLRCMLNDVREVSTQLQHSSASCCASGKDSPSDSIN